MINASVCPSSPPRPQSDRGTRSRPMAPVLEEEPVPTHGVHHLAARLGDPIDRESLQHTRSGHLAPGQGLSRFVYGPRARRPGTAARFARPRSAVGTCRSTSPPSGTDATCRTAQAAQVTESSASIRPPHPSTGTRSADRYDRIRSGRRMQWPFWTGVAGWSDICRYVSDPTQVWISMVRKTVRCDSPGGSDERSVLHRFNAAWPPGREATPPTP